MSQKEPVKGIDLNRIEGKNIEVIAGVLSLSKDGFGSVRLGAALKSAQKLETMSTPVGGEATPPKVIDEGFVRARFRALSQVLIEDYWLDFRKPGVLEKAAAMLKNQTVYADHEVSVNKWIGAVENSFWDGKSEPNGIDADLKIDSVENPRIARGLTIVPPAIHSASVTSYFKWSKSHPALDDFWWLLGEEVDGETVRIIVDLITQIAEISLVWQGADPFAKRKFTAEMKKELGKFFNAAEVNSLSAKMSANKKGGTQMPPDETQTTPESNEKIQSLEKEVKGFKEKAESLEKENETLKKDAELGKKFAEELAKETESLYRLTKGTSADENYIETIIKKGSVESLQAFKKDYKDSLKDKLFLTCPHCGKEIKGIRASFEGKKTEETSEVEYEKYKV